MPTGSALWLFPLPIVAIIGEYFKKRLTLALALVLSGTGAGQCIMSVLIQLLLDEYGWRGTLLILGAINLNICVAGALMRPTKFYSKNYNLGLYSYKVHRTADSKHRKTYEEVNTEEAHALEDLTVDKEDTDVQDQTGTSSDPEISELNVEADDNVRHKRSGRRKFQNCQPFVKALSPDWSLCCNIAFVLLEVTGFLHAAAHTSIISHIVSFLSVFAILEFNWEMHCITDLMSPYCFPINSSVRRLKIFITIDMSMAVDTFDQNFPYLLYTICNLFMIIDNT